jgi:predicted glycogen debranching enzyme
MKIQHSFNGEQIEGESKDKYPQFILTNKHGGFFLGSSGSTITKFNGLFFPIHTNDGWDFFKTIEFIGIPKDADFIRNSISQVTLQKDIAEETFFLNHTHSMLYEVKKYSGAIKLILDCKKLYDGSEFGRIYFIEKENGCIVIHYKKFLDSSLASEQYSFYVAIKTNMKDTFIGEWNKKEYLLDKSRGSSFDAYVYDALSFVANSSSTGTIAIGFSKDKKTAILNAKNIFKNKITLKQLKTKYVNSLLLSEFNTKKDSLIYANIISHYDDLIMEMQEIGIFAGLPWFFQFWARDEAIASIGLLSQERYDEMKNILLRWLFSSSSGRIPNRFPTSDLPSADSTGWVLFRLHQLLSTLKEKNLLKEYFSSEEIKKIYSFAKSRVDLIIEKYEKAGMIYNESLETWMDTGVHLGDIRSGFRIEIQALQIAAYKFLIFLEQELGVSSSFYSNKKNSLIDVVRREFYNGIYLFDGLNDPIIRPNIFIAAYVAPDLLPKKNWDICFRKVLTVLYKKTESGGNILTIDPTSPLFCSSYTGENNDSYHRGDSWYWLNCLVATVLVRRDFSRYKEYISSLKKSFVQELLWSGAIGCSAELSSSNKTESHGCLSQAWSYGMFLELIHEEQSF